MHRGMTGPTLKFYTTNHLSMSFARPATAGAAASKPDAGMPADVVQLVSTAVIVSHGADVYAHAVAAPGLPRW